jgi:hypothetical protein
MRNKIRVRIWVTLSLSLTLSHPLSLSLSLSLSLKNGLNDKMRALETQSEKNIDRLEKRGDLQNGKLITMVSGVRVRVRGRVSG